MKKILYSVLITLTFTTLSFAQDSPQWHLPEGAKMRLGKGRANEIAYSPDGTKLAVASAIGIWIYDAQTGEEVNLIPVETSPINTIAFSPDGKMIVSDIDYRSICLWDVETGAKVRWFWGHSHPSVNAIAFSPNGKMFVSGGIGSTVRLWDVETSRQLYVLRRHGGSVNSVAFSPDGKTFVSAGSDKSIRLWDVDTGIQLREFKGHTKGVSSVAFHPDGEIIASGSGDKTVRLWDVKTGTQQESLNMHTEGVSSVAFSPDGKTLASGSVDNTIRLWRVADLSQRYVLKEDVGSITTVVFGADNNTLASRSRDGTIHLWNDITGLNGWVGWERHTITGHVNGVENAAFSPDGNTLLSGGRDGIMQLWDVNTGTKQHAFVGHTGYIDSVAFSPDGKTIASGSEDGTLRLWDADTGTERHTLINMLGEVDDVTFSPDSKTVACVMLTGDYNPSIHLRSSIIYLFDVETGTELHAIAAYNAPPPPAYSYESGFHPTEHRLPINSIAMSPHGNLIASSSSDRTIRLWHVQTGEHLRMLTAQAGWTRSIAFSPDGTMLAGVSNSENIILWDVQTGTQLRTFTGHTDDVGTIMFNPDGNTLVGACEDGPICLWDVSSGMLLRAFPGHKGRAYLLALSADGSTLASSRGGTILLWDLNAPLPSNTTVSLSPVSVESPVVGEHLTLSLNIGYGQNVAGYQATVHFDTTTLRYVASANGDYLPASAYVMPPVVENNRVMLAATTFAEERSDEGTLATITFEVIATKASTVRLSDVLLTDIAGNSTKPKIAAATEITEPMFLPEDVNEDGVVNILDLVFIGTNFGKTGKNAADVNGDGVVNIVDLALVAAKIGEMDAAAPALWSIKEKDMPTRATVEAWLKEARQLNLADPTFQRGLLVLESLLKALTPKETALLPNYPNPFNPETWIPYQLATPANVSISIYAADGKLIRQLDLGHQLVGMYHHRSRAAHWDGKNAQGEPVASGVYFYTFTVGDFTATRKMLIRK